MADIPEKLPMSTTTLAPSEGTTTIHNYQHKGTEGDGEEPYEDDDMSPLDEDESRSLLHQTYIPCSTETSLQLSLSLRSYDGYSERFQPYRHHHSLPPAMTVLNISTNNGHHQHITNFGIHQHPTPSILQETLVPIRLSEDLDDVECISSSSPFHSAVEDFHEPESTRDRDPLLIRGPVKKGGFHQFLTSVKHPIQAHHHHQGNSSNNNQEETINGIHQDHHKPGSVEVSQPRRPICSFGILLATISCIFFATSALIVKVSVLHPMELLAVRGLIQWILVAPIVISSGNSFFGPKGSRSLLLARAILGSVALIMSFASIHLIPLADAATVIFTSPVFVSIFACVCLGEICSLFDVAMIGLTLLGVLLVSKPSFGFINSGSWEGIVGTTAGLIASMLTALAFIVLRQLKHVHYSVTVLWFSTVLTSFGTILTIALGNFTVPTQWLSIVECIGIGLCGFFGQVLLTKALQIENAGPVAVARTMDIVLAFFYQITLLHDTPDWYSYLGSLLVVSCVLLTALRRWYLEGEVAKRNVNDKDSIGSSQILS